MLKALLRLANFLTVLFLATAPTHADSILVGTALASPTPGPELCPIGSGCNYRFSQFSTPQLFLVDDIKVAIGGPVFDVLESTGNFQVSVITHPGASQTLIANVGAGFLAFSPSQPQGSANQVFDFNNLSILLDPGVEYYLEVTGGNLFWDEDTPLLGTLGTLGQQLSCDPSLTCSGGISRYDTFPLTYAMRISGNVATPEPSTWLLFAIGLFFLCGLLYFNSSQNHPSRISQR
jgi:hypothetical protein